MIDNKILKHKYLFIFLVFAFSVLFCKIDSQAAEINNDYYYTFSNYDSTAYFTNNYTFSSEHKIALVYAGETTGSAHSQIPPTGSLKHPSP